MKLRRKPKEAALTNGPERRPFHPEAGALIRNPAGQLLLVRYRAEPGLWSAPRMRIGWGHEP